MEGNVLARMNCVMPDFLRHQHLEHLPGNVRWGLTRLVRAALNNGKFGRLFTLLRCGARPGA